MAAIALQETRTLLDSEPSRDHVVRPLLQSGGAGDRRRVVRILALSQPAGPSVAEALRALLADPDRTVRVESAGLLPAETRAEARADGPGDPSPGAGRGR